MSAIRRARGGARRRPCPVRAGAETGLQFGRRFAVERGIFRRFEIKAGHVVEHQRIELAHAFKVHQQRGGGLIDHGGRYALHRLEHGVEGGAIERVAAHGDEALERGAVLDDGHQATFTMTLPMALPESMRR